jgi:hypothetical protein
MSYGSAVISFNNDIRSVDEYAIQWRGPQSIPNAARAGQHLAFRVNETGVGELLIYGLGLQRPEPSPTKFFRTMSIFVYPVRRSRTSP